MRKLVAINEFSCDQAYKIMVAREQVAVAREATHLLNMGCSHVEALAEILQDHTHSALRGVVMGTVRSVYNQKAGQS